MRQVAVEIIHYRKPFLHLSATEAIFIFQEKRRFALKNNSGNLVLLGNPTLYHLQQFTTLLWN